MKIKIKDVRRAFLSTQKTLPPMSLSFLIEIGQVMLAAIGFGAKFLFLKIVVKISVKIVLKNLSLVKFKVRRTSKAMQ